MKSNLRDIRGPAQSRAIQDLIQGIFVSELMKPSDELWFSFAWISDIVIFDNSSRKFGSIEPDWPIGQIRLSRVLETLLSHGTQVFVIMRKHHSNDDFIEKLKQLEEIFGSKLQKRVKEKFHEKGLLGQNYFLSGSMNLTKSGISTNHERVYYTTDQSLISKERVTLRGFWKELYL